MKKMILVACLLLVACGGPTLTPTQSASTPIVEPARTMVPETIGTQTAYVANMELIRARADSDLADFKTYIESVGCRTVQDSTTDAVFADCTDAGKNLWQVQFGAIGSDGFFSVGSFSTWGYLPDMSTVTFTEGQAQFTGKEGENVKTFTITTSSLE